MRVAIDVELGLTRVAGVLQVYEASLRIWGLKIPEASEKISAYLAAEEFAKYAIEVHGMKSSLANMGAAELSELAAKLEYSAKNNIYDVCRKNMYEFLNRLNLLGEQLNRIYAEETPVQGKPAGSTELLNENLNLLRDSFDSFNSNLAGEIIEKLSGFTFGGEIDAK